MHTGAAEETGAHAGGGGGEAGLAGRREAEGGGGYGAAAQLGYVLASVGGSAGILRNAERIQKDFDKLWNDLNATNDKGESLEAGPYDKYFDPLSKIESPRPLLSATSGADQPANQTSQTLGQTALFSIHQVI